MPFQVQINPIGPSGAIDGPCRTLKTDTKQDAIDLAIVEIKKVLQSDARMMFGVFDADSRMVLSYTTSTDRDKPLSDAG